MNTIYSILVSDGALALHFLLTMVLLALVILRWIQSDMTLRRVASENNDLKRQMTELSEFMSGSFHNVHLQMDNQRDAVCHTAEYLLGAANLDARRFDGLQNLSNDDTTAASNELLAVDLVYDDFPGPDLSLAESAFVEPEPNHREPDVSMPIKASMISVPAEAEELIEATVESIQARSDLMTRVLRQSREQ